MISSTTRSRHSHLAVACAVGCLLAPAFMNAQIDRSRPPVPGPAPDVRLGEHSTDELPNGMKIIVVEDHKLPLVSVQLRFEIPPVAQGKRTGYVDMMGDLLGAGTTGRTKNQIDMAVDAIGASFQTSSNGVYASVLRKNLEPLMEILQDVVKDPTFPNDELESLRARNRSSVQQRHEDPDGMAEAVGRAVTFSGTHPYGEVTTEITLGKVDRVALVAYHKYFFRPERAYLVFVGDITLKEAKDLAKQHFGKWKPAVVPTTTDEHGHTQVDGIGALYPLKAPHTPSGVRRAFLIDRPGAAQSVIRVSFPLGVVPKDVRAQQSQVMNTILGGGVFNARLMQNLREKRAYTYGAYSSLDLDRFNSSFTASVSVRTAVTDSAVSEILSEIERMRDEPVTAEELELAKRYMMGSFGRSLEDPRTVARFALNTELNGMPADYYRSYLSRLAGVTVQQVQDAARAFLAPDQAVILVVGDKEEVIDGLAALSLQQNEPVVQLTEDGAFWREELEKVTDRTAEQILETYIHAIGGRDALVPLRNVKFDRTAKSATGERTTTQWIGPGQFRTLVKEGPVFIQEVIYDGQRAQLDVPAGTGELTDAALDAVRWEGMLVPEVDYDKSMEKRLLPGSTTLNGKKVFKLMFFSMSGMTFSDYFDAETGLKVRRVQQKYLDGRSYATRTDYSDWRSINGVLVPHTTVERGGPDGKVTTTLGAVEVNKTPAPGFFEVNIPELPEMPMEPDWVPPVEKE